jgi:archaea-specific RecJ-like exonuclease
MGRQFEKKGFRKKEFNKFKPRFERDKSRSFDEYIHKEIKSLEIREINHDLINNEVIISGRVNKISQTGGPTMFSVSDGTGTLALKGFAGMGIRSYPEINEGDTVKAKVVISEFANELEGEIKTISKLSLEEHKEYLEKILSMERKRAEVLQVPFLVKSDVLTKLQATFIKAATEIRLAIIQNRPIIVRHHNDTDGYCAGYALEKAILPLIEKEHGSEKAGWEFFLRSPCAAPFYEIDDSIRDTAISLRNVAKFSNKMPLVIITDNGSTPEDLFGILHGNVHGMEFIVIDHHYFEKDVISENILTHINPFLVEEDGTKFSAGMLCAEFARFINSKVEGLEPIPALAGFADRIDINNPGIMEEYLKLAKKQGYTRELLADISCVIDFVSAKIKFLEGREYIGVIFGEPRDKQKALVDLMAPYIRRLEEKGLAIARTNASIEKIGKNSLQILNIENSFPGFGFYPKPGKVIGLIHDDLQKNNKSKNLITVGLMNTAMTFRATDEANFSVHDLINYLSKKSPDSFVEGGGHKNAGSITFIPNKKEEIFKLLKKFIEERQ